jgi:transcription elongation GreA/GreB family factor
MQISERNAAEARKRDTGPVHLSKEGLKRLENQLTRLKRELPELIAETARTAAYGDRSDNAEYKDAKGRLRRTQWKILEIQDEIKRVVIIPIGPNMSGMIQAGSTVVVELNGTQKTFQILGSRETNPDRGRISFMSPLGAALMNHKKGDVVTVKTKNGPREYRIIGVELR